MTKRKEKSWNKKCYISSFNIHGFPIYAKHVFVIDYISLLIITNEFLFNEREILSLVICLNHRKIVTFFAMNGKLYYVCVYVQQYGQITHKFHLFIFPWRTDKGVEIRYHISLCRYTTCFYIQIFFLYLQTSLGRHLVLSKKTNDEIWLNFVQYSFCYISPIRITHKIESEMRPLYRKKK